MSRMNENDMSNKLENMGENNTELRDRIVENTKEINDQEQEF